MVRSEVSVCLLEIEEVVLERDTIIERSHINQIIDSGVETILLHKEEGTSSDHVLVYNTLQKDPTNSEVEAVRHIYRQLRSAEAPDDETARGIIEKLFFSDQRYSLGHVGRFRINSRLKLDISEDKMVLTNKFPNKYSMNFRGENITTFLIKNTAIHMAGFTENPNDFYRFVESSFCKVL